MGRGHPAAHPQRTLACTPGRRPHIWMQSPWRVPCVASGPVVGPRAHEVVGPNLGRHSPRQTVPLATTVPSQMSSTVVRLLAKRSPVKSSVPLVQGNRILMEAVPRRGETLFCVPEIRCQTTKTRSLRHRRHIGTGQMKCKQPAQGSIKLECDCPGHWCRSKSASLRPRRRAWPSIAVWCRCRC